MVKIPVLLERLLIIEILVLFIGLSINPSTGIIVEKTIIKNVESRDYIQDLIDNASDGDTINIPSGIYYENIIIDKSISLFGEDKNTTIIDGGGIGDVIYVSADWVNISGFTIQNSGGEYNSGFNHDGTYYCSIKDNIIVNNFHGILFCFNYYKPKGCDYNTIQKNMIIDNTVGIKFAHAYNAYNKIFNNNICTNNFGIYVESCNFNEIYSNNILSNIEIGISLDSCICGGYQNRIYHNNIIYNGDENGQAQNADLINYWDDGYPSGGNFWSDYTGLDNFSGPNQTIPGSDGIGDTPYEIPSNYIDIQDSYPLMQIWDRDFPPIAEFNWIPYIPEPGEEIFFNASESYDYDGDITLYEWDWDDDGEYDESNTGPTTTQTFVNAGFYPVTLRVNSNNFETDTTRNVILVNTLPNIPTIDGPVMGKPNIEYDFTFKATDPDGDDVRYLIDWGDDTSDVTEYNPSGTDVIASHTWSTKGTYEITAKAMDIFGLIGPEAKKVFLCPKDKVLQTSPFLNLLHSHPSLFLLLQKLIQ